MNLSYENLTLSANAAVDLQLHTHLSDGTWTPDALLNHLQAEGFALAAITDHERVDTAAELQRLAIEQNFPLLVAAEMTAMWKGDLTDFLCYGFSLEPNALDDLAQDVTRRQHENSKQVFEQLVSMGLSLKLEDLDTLLAQPAAYQLKALEKLVNTHYHGEKSWGHVLMEAGFEFIASTPADIVEAAHQSGAVCILAHPGRDDGFVQYDVALLDELRAEANIDGIEAYYPLHTPEQTAMYQAYAGQHKLLVSSGSDSHSADKSPIKYQAALSQKLLERLGITIS